MFGKEKEPDYSKVLPGVVKVSNSLYYDQTEITNLNWNEYLHWIAEKSGRKSAEYQDALPDTNVWGGNGCCDSVMMNLYLRHPEFRDYPVVGVTQTQAMRYCAWRTDRVKENLAANKKEKKAPVQYLYRLPSIEEWNTITQNTVLNTIQKGGAELLSTRFSSMVQAKSIIDWMSNERE